MFTLKELSKDLKVTKRTLFRWIKLGKLKVVRIDNLIRVEDKEYNRLLGTTKKNSRLRK